MLLLRKFSEEKKCSRKGNQGSKRRCLQFGQGKVREFEMLENLYQAYIWCAKCSTIT